MSAKTTVHLPFGKSRVSVEARRDRLLGVFTPGEVAEAHDEAALVRAALDHPIGSPRLREMARPGQRVVIVTSDLTRPCPSDRLLPPVLEELRVAGVAEKDVTVVEALGIKLVDVRET